MLSVNHKFSTYKNATLCINHKAGHGVHPSHGDQCFYGGIYDQYNNFIYESSFNRWQKPLICPGHIGACNQLLKGEYIFGGYIFPHYGHFLLESLSRLWFTKYANMTIIFVGIHKNIVTCTDQQLYILQKVLQIKNNIVVIDKQVKIEQITIPNVGMQITANNLLIDKEHIEFLKKYDCYDIKKKYNIWLSRSDLLHTKTQEYEKSIESMLMQLGWLIIKPHRHTIENQLDLLSKAKIIAGLEGSAFHTILFFKNYYGKIVLFNRGRSMPKMQYILRDLRPELDIEIVPEHLCATGVVGFLQSTER